MVIGRAAGNKEGIERDDTNSNYSPSWLRFEDPDEDNTAP